MFEENSEILPSKVIVWSAILVPGLRRLHIVQETINGAKYTCMFSSRLRPQIRDWFEQKLCIF